MTKNYEEKITLDVLRLRLAQMFVNEDYKAGKFKIPIHLALGHESLCVAVNEMMEEEDKLILSHRNIAYNLTRERRLRPILDEYFLKSSGLMGGKLGSMNLTNPSKGIMYSSSILGNSFSVAVGIALAQKILSQNGITIVLGGDGSIEEGSFYESLIMFKSLQLNPLIIIENNEWSMATRINERRQPINLEKLCEAHDIKYAQLSGNDPFQYIEELKKLRRYALEFISPVCIEVFVTTLGDWRMKTPEFPNGKYINYHAGPAPSVDLKNNTLIIRTNEDDPVFVVSKRFNEIAFKEMSNLVLEEIRKELV